MPKPAPKKKTAPKKNPAKKTAGAKAKRAKKYKKEQVQYQEFIYDSTVGKTDALFVDQPAFPQVQPPAQLPVQTLESLPVETEVKKEPAEKKASWWQKIIKLIKKQ